MVNIKNPQEVLDAYYNVVTIKHMINEAREAWKNLLNFNHTLVFEIEKADKPQENIVLHLMQCAEDVAIKKYKEAFWYVYLHYNGDYNNSNEIFMTKYTELKDGGEIGNVCEKVLYILIPEIVGERFSDLLLER